MHPTRIAHAVAIAAARGNGQDRARLVELAEDVVIALADGAGGTGNGTAAAQAVMDAVGAIRTAEHDWCELLSELDRDVHRLGHGQTTAVVISIRGGVLSGASVGDSGAWLVRERDILDLTHDQERKPLVGSGCTPWRIRPTKLDGATLLVASDGLLRYAKPPDITRLANNANLSAAAPALVDLVRLRNGELQDDVAVVLCRERLPAGPPRTV